MKSAWRSVPYTNKIHSVRSGNIRYCRRRRKTLSGRRARWRTSRLLWEIKKEMSGKNPTRKSQLSLALIIVLDYSFVLKSSVHEGTIWCAGVHAKAAAGRGDAQATGLRPQDAADQRALKYVATATCGQQQRCFCLQHWTDWTGRTVRFFWMTNAPTWVQAIKLISHERAWGHYCKKTFF